MYKNFNRRRDQKYCRSERWYGENSILFNALKSDDIDGYLEFTGTVLGELTKEPLKSKEEKKFMNKLSKVLKRNIK